MFILQEQKNAYINIYMQIGRNLECLSACAGNIRKVQELCKRSRGSMAAILNLGEAVLEPPDPEEAARDELKRTKAMAGETATIWAIQPTEDPASRQALPSWVSLPLEKGVAKWGEENKKWEVKINRRLNEGKCLTPADQAKYDNFREKRSELKFLFNKETQSHLVKIRSNASLKNLFSLQVNMSSNADDLKVRAGSGAFHKLVMLQGDTSRVHLFLTIPHPAPGKPFFPDVIPGYHSHMVEVPSVTGIRVLDMNHCFFCLGVSAF